MFQTSHNSTDLLAPIEAQHIGEVSVIMTYARGFKTSHILHVRPHLQKNNFISSSSPFYLLLPLLFISSLSFLIFCLSPPHVSLNSFASPTDLLLIFFLICFFYFPCCGYSLHQLVLIMHASCLHILFISSSLSLYLKVNKVNADWANTGECRGLHMDSDEYRPVQCLASYKIVLKLTNIL